MTIRKLFSRAAAVVLSLCIAGGATGFEPGEFAAFAETTKGTYEYFEYENTGSSITITGQSQKPSEDVTELVIPSYIDGLPVTAISGSGFRFVYEKLIIPETVTNIDASSGLISATQYIEIDDDNSNYYDVDGVVFSHDGKTLVRYPAQRVGGYSIPDTVTKIGDYAFSRCENHLLYIDIPDSVETLGKYCFTMSYNMASITIPESVKLIDEGAFRLYGYIESITILNPFCEIGEDAFAVISGAIIYGYDNSTTANYVNNSYSPDYIMFKSLGEYKAKTNLIYQTEGDSSIISKNVKFSKDLNTILDETYSTTYSPELAYMLSIMSQSAYGEPYIKANYHELGFENKTALYDYDTTYTQDDNCGYVIGYQDLEDGTREYLITVRGTANPIYNPFGEEWWSDFNIGFGQINPWVPCPDYHDGFKAAADRIYESLQEYNDGTIRTKKVRYVLTGHSRGAAVSNIVSKWLIDAGVSKNDLYSYNFACPGTASDKESEFTSSKYNSIFNLNCARDLVGQAPGEKLTLLSIPFLGTMGSKDPAQWGKYGQTYFWDADWDSSKSASVSELGTYHPCDKNYIPYFSQQHELSEFKTFYDIKNIQDSNWNKLRTATLVKQINIFPPFESKVGATISDATGNIVATLKNGMLEIVSGMEDKMIGNIDEDGVIQIAVDSSEEYQVSVTSDEPVTIAVAQGNQNYNSVNNGAVYTAAPGNTTIDIAPDTPAAETHVTDASGKAIEPDKVWNLGDVNGDRSANIADAVLLQKWLLNKPDSDLTEWTAADIYEDGKLNVYDLTLLKQLITE